MDWFLLDRDFRYERVKQHSLLLCYSGQIIYDVFRGYRKTKFFPMFSGGTEKPNFFRCFQGVSKGTSGMKWVKTIQHK